MLLIKNWSCDAGKGEELFSSLSVWEDGEMREQQGAWPVIFLSFAGVKAARFSEARAAICQLLTELYSDFEFLCGEDGITEKDKAFFDRVDYDMADNIGPLLCGSFPV